MKALGFYKRNQSKYSIYTGYEYWTYRLSKIEFVKVTTESENKTEQHLYKMGEVKKHKKHAAQVR